MPKLSIAQLRKNYQPQFWAQKYFSPYLYVYKFVIYTEHRLLEWLYPLKEPNLKLKIQEYNIKIFYRSRKRNLNADAICTIQIDPLTTASKPHPTSIKYFGQL